MRRTGTTRRFLLASGLAIGLILPIPGLAQSRPVGGEASSSPPAQTVEKGAEHVRATLGGCPVEALRAAWAEMDALGGGCSQCEEVLRLCTARARSHHRTTSPHSATWTERPGTFCFLHNASHRPGSRTPLPPGPCPPRQRTSRTRTPRRRKSPPACPRCAARWTSCGPGWRCWKPDRVDHRHCRPRVPPWLMPKHGLPQRNRMWWTGKPPPLTRRSPGTANESLVPRSCGGPQTGSAGPAGTGPHRSRWHHAPRSDQSAGLDRAATSVRRG